MTKNNLLFLLLLTFFCATATVTSAFAQQYDDMGGGSSGGGDDLGLAIPDSAYSGGSDAGVTGPKLGTHYVPQWSSDFDIAAIYYKLRGAAPDIGQWAMSTDEYKAVANNAFERQSVLENQMADLRSKFSVLSLNDDIVIRMAVQVGEYSPLNQGFIVGDEFSEHAFFRYNFGGEHFAVVPQKLEDEKWVSAPPNIAADITAAAEKSKGRLVNAALFVKPVYASKQPAQLDENYSYNLISATIDNIMFFDAGWKKVIWERNSDKYNKEQKNDLLNLKQ
ncbi:MAG: hypothetical protein GC185_05720 [Alphaproteobacteria bacterium]|nr:hypothetical protein [Alphaproteobacteria bacterium]